MRKSFIGVAIAAVVAFIIAIPTILGLFGAFGSADGGHVVVVRNGGLFDDTSVYKVQQPNSGVEYQGLWSEAHPYPAGQRFYKVSSEAGSDANKNINVQSKDGFGIALEGTFYFELTRDDATLREFDDRFGTRTFDVGNNEKAAAWESDAGWSAFLNSTIGNFVENSVAQEFVKVNCADVVPACAYLTTTSAEEAVEAVGTINTESQRVTIQNAIQKTFSDEISTKLGGNYFTNVQFVLTNPTLPGEQLAAVAAAQTANASQQKAVTEAQTEAQVNQTKANSAKIIAETNAAANAITQEGYASCPVCAQIDLTKALPQGLTTYIPGAAPLAVAVQ